MNRNLLMSGILFIGLVLSAADNKTVAPEAADPSWGAPLPWSRFAEVSTLPGLQGISLLNDGDLATAGMWCTGSE